MSIPSAASFIRSDFRSRFEPTLWSRLVSLGRPRDVAAGEVLIRRGIRSSHIFAVEQGALEVVDRRSSPETVLQVLESGEIVGEMSFVDGAVPSADVRARGPSRCLVFGHEPLARGLDADRELSLAFYQALAGAAVERLRAVTTAAVVGGLGAHRPTSRGEAEEAQALQLARPLLRFAVDEPNETEFSRRVGEAAAFLARAPAPRAAGVGEHLRRLLSPIWGQSPLAQALLAHSGEGRLLAAASPAGMVDQVLGRLDTPLGWVWREAEMVRRIRRVVVLGDAAVVVHLSLGEPLSAAFADAVSATRYLPIHLTASGLAVSPDRATPERPAGADAQTNPQRCSPLDFFPLGGPPVVPVADVIALDSPVDSLPDTVLRTVVLWASRQLRSGGRLLVGYSAPAEDVAFLDHVLGWPTLPRRSNSLISLFPPGGEVRSLARHPDAAGRLLTWVRP